MCNSYSPLSTLLNSTNQQLSNTPTKTQKLGINIEHIMESNRGAVIGCVCCVLGSCLVTLWTMSGSTWYHQSFTHISRIGKLVIALYTLCSGNVTEPLIYEATVVVCVKHDWECLKVSYNKRRLLYTQQWIHRLQQQI